MDRPCPDDSKKVQHLYVSLRVLEISLLTLFMSVRVKYPQMLTLCIGMERYCPKDSKNVSVVDIGLV